MGLTFLDEPGRALDPRRALQLVGPDFSPRWIIDGMIRTGPCGDRYLPWRKGWNIAQARRSIRTASGSASSAPASSREKLLTPDKRIHLRRDDIEARGRRASSRAAPRRPTAAFPFRLIGRRDIRSNNSWLRNVPKLMRGDR